MKTRHETIPGSGLNLAAFLFLLVTSVALFVGWGGVLWSAPREASHATRFAVSYLAVIPLAAIVLVALRRLTWAHLVTSTGAVWAFKLVITAVLYQFTARGTATDLRAVAPPPSAILGNRAEPRPDYHAAEPGAFAAGTLRGRVRLGGKAVGGAIVFLDTPAPGRAAPAAEKVELVIEGARYGGPLYLAHVDDEIRFANRDGTLHTARFSGAGRLPATLPMPPGSGPRRVVFPEPGVFRVRCDNHAGEGAWLVVVDHPYATRTAADGSYALEGVPAGVARVIAVTAPGLSAQQGKATTVVRAVETVELDVDFDSAPEI